jgi:anthranilate/para-aminobenzoate synthase component I
VTAITEALLDLLDETAGACALLESTGAPGPLARRRLLARHPRAVMVADGDGTRIVTRQGQRTLAGDPLDHLRALAAELPAAEWPEGGAVVGALAYDYARPRRAPSSAPRLVALAVDQLAVVEGGDVRVPAPSSPLDVDLALPAHEGPPPEAGGTIHLDRHSNLSRAEYHEKVRRLKEHIAAGDIYQANLSQQFRVRCPGGGLALYRRLRARSPAPFAGYLRVGGLEIVSASPERLLEVDGGRLATRPIAGTRPRAADPDTDRALAAELLLSEKERAEHLMLVDLARNDLGRVAEVGSVTVDELMVVEHYAHVRHIVSNVTARLARGRDAVDGLRALFPGGTITGVPKVRCMDILDATEPTPRGFYTGSLFYLTAGGRLDANILIRSAVVAAGVATFHTGGGIVADSDPDREYEETLHKAEGLRVALEAEPL